MKFFEEWKLKRECKKSGRSKEYDEYKRVKESLNKEKLYYQKVLKDAEDAFNNIKANFDPSTPEYKNALGNVNRWRYTLDETILQEEYIRPNSQEDISYREQIIDSFNNQLKEILADDSTIRFHGTPIYYAKEILKSGGIFSSAARYENFNKSTDLVDEISASSISTIDRTLSIFTDFYAFQRLLPAGCLFVLRANKEEDQELMKYDSMKAFNFFSEPERVLAICTTPENIEMVRGWLEEFGYDKKKAYIYDDFLKIAHTLKTPSSTPPEDKNDNINNEESEINELISMLDEEDTLQVEVEEQKGKIR